MPYKSYGCSICGKQGPKTLREDGEFVERMRWLRRHYKRNHPTAFKRMEKKSIKTRKANR